MRLSLSLGIDVFALGTTACIYLLFLSFVYVLAYVWRVTRRLWSIRCIYIALSLSWRDKLFFFFFFFALIFLSVYRGVVIVLRRMTQFLAAAAGGRALGSEYILYEILHAMAHVRYLADNDKQRERERRYVENQVYTRKFERSLGIYWALMREKDIYIV